MKELTKQQINLLGSLVAVEMEGLENTLANLPDLPSEVIGRADIGVMLKALKEVQDILEPVDPRLPEGYAEIDYPSMETPEAIDGARFDDMNYQHYMER